MLKISTMFEGGSIEVVDAANPNRVRLRLAADNAADVRQWFYFRVQGAAYTHLNLCIENAADAAFPNGWEHYRAVCSYDRENWFRVNTTYDADTGCLNIDHTPLAGSVYYAYFEPYSYERHLNLLGRVQGSGLCQIDDLGSTVDGRDINLLTIGNQAASDRKIWIIARQHSGETMAEWFVEGLLERLLDSYDGTARALLDAATFYVVPNMNPDGSVRGNMRTNAAGVNLNRVWHDPCPQTAPEVTAVRAKMHEIGVDLLLDIHGDEEIPFVFAVGNEGIVSYTPRLAALEAEFKTHFQASAPDFQTIHGYPIDAAGTAVAGMANHYAAQTFDCLALTLEMPFSDAHNWPDDDFGWHGQRALRLGEAVLTPILAMLHKLR